MDELDEKAILDLTLEVARLESAERTAFRAWCAAKEGKEQKLAELLALSHSLTLKPPQSPAEVRPEKRKRGKISVKMQARQFLDANPGQEFTTSEIAHAIGAPPNSVSVYLRSLSENGEITRLDYGRYQAKQRA